MIHMQCKTCNRKANHMLQRSSYYKLKKPNTYRVLPANDWMLLEQGAWWNYPVVGFVWAHGSRLSSLSRFCLLENGTHLYVLCFRMKNWVLCNAYDTGLSQRSGTWVYSSPKSIMVYVIHRSWEQQLAATTHLASVVDCAILDCSQEDQDTKEDPENQRVPELDFLSRRQPAKSTSEKPWSVKEEDAEYQSLKSWVYRKYLKILLIACQCDVLGDAWKRAHRHTLNCMSGLIAIRYRREPIMLQFSF
jgi:hypothetical protein